MPPGAWPSAPEDYALWSEGAVRRVRELCDELLGPIDHPEPTAVNGTAVHGESGSGEVLPKVCTAPLGVGDESPGSVRQ